MDKTDWDKVYGDLVRAGKQYIHVAAADVPSFQEWVRGRLTDGAWKRIHKGVQIHISEITE